MNSAVGLIKKSISTSFSWSRNKTKNISKRLFEINIWSCKLNFTDFFYILFQLAQLLFIEVKFYQFLFTSPTLIHNDTLLVYPRRLHQNLCIHIYPYHSMLPFYLTLQFFLLRSISVYVTTQIPTEEDHFSITGFSDLS